MKRRYVYSAPAVLSKPFVWRLGIQEPAWLWAQKWLGLPNYPWHEVSATFRDVWFLNSNVEHGEDICGCPFGEQKLQKEKTIKKTKAFANLCQKGLAKCLTTHSKRLETPSKHLGKPAKCLDCKTNICKQIVLQTFWKVFAGWWNIRTLMFEIVWM